MRARGTPAAGPAGALFCFEVMNKKTLSDEFAQLWDKTNGPRWAIGMRGDSRPRNLERATDPGRASVSSSAK